MLDSDTRPSISPRRSKAKRTGVARAEARTVARSEIAIELHAQLRSVVTDPWAWAEHIVSSSPDDVAARLGMADAIKRRFASGRELVAKVRRIGAGRFVVATSAQSSYRVELYGRGPGEAACDCRDFLRSALGVCKHIAHVLEGAPRGFARPPALGWNPIRPWTGPDAPWWRLEHRASRAPSRRGWIEIHPGLWRPEPVSDLDALTTLARSLSAFARRGDHEVSAAAMAVIDELVAYVAREREFSAGAARAGRGAMKRKLFSYQREGVARLVRTGRLLLGDDMGLGKTTQAISAAASLFAAGVCRRVLVVVPAALKTQWAREWSDVTRVPLTMIEGRPEDRRDTLGRIEHGIVLMNYEQVVRDADRLRAWSPDLMILDEAQRIKNWAAKTSLVMKSFAPRYRWILTGTPFENRLGELASLVEWLDDFAMEPKWRLECFHAVRADGETAVIGAKNLSTLRARIGHCVVRRTRAEVLSQLPERTDIARVVPLTDWQRSDHDVMNRDIGQLATIRRRRPLTQQEFLRLMSLLNRQRMICNAAILPDDQDAWTELRAASPSAALPSLGSPKLEELRELVRELCVVQGRKVAVFSQWRRMLKWAHWAVADLLEDAGLAAGFFTGGEGEARRRENIIRFHDDPSFRVLFLSDAGGVGLNLQRAASALVNLEVPWNPAVLEQRIGRIYRFGQKDPVEIFLVSSGEGIEARIAGLVGDKKALFKGIFEGGSDAIAFERSGSFLNQLERVLPGAASSNANARAPRADERDDDDAELTPDVRAPAEAAATADDDARVEANGRPRGAAAPFALTAPATGPAPLADPFCGVSMQRTESGGLRIEATAESAVVLESMFRAMADLFAGAARAN